MQTDLGLEAIDFVFNRYNINHSTFYHPRAGTNAHTQTQCFGCSLPPLWTFKPISKLNSNSSRKVDDSYPWHLSPESYQIGWKSTKSKVQLAEINGFMQLVANEEILPGETVFITTSDLTFQVNVRDYINIAESEWHIRPLFQYLDPYLTSLTANQKPESASGEKPLSTLDLLAESSSYHRNKQRNHKVAQLYLEEEQTMLSTCRDILLKATEYLTLNDDTNRENQLKRQSLAVFASLFVTRGDTLLLPPPGKLPVCMPKLSTPAHSNQFAQPDPEYLFHGPRDIVRTGTQDTAPAAIDQFHKEMAHRSDTNIRAIDSWSALWGTSPLLCCYKDILGSGDALSGTGLWARWCSEARYKLRLFREVAQVLVNAAPAQFLFTGAAPHTAGGVRMGFLARAGLDSRGPLARLFLLADALARPVQVPTLPPRAGLHAALGHVGPQLRPQRGGPPPRQPRHPHPPAPQPQPRAQPRTPRGRVRAPAPRGKATGGRGGRTLRPLPPAPHSPTGLHQRRVFVPAHTRPQRCPGHSDTPHKARGPTDPVVHPTALPAFCREAAVHRGQVRGGA